MQNTSAHPSTPTGFTVQLHRNQIHITAEAPSAERAVSFVCDLHECHEVLGSVWRWQDERWVMNVYDLDTAWNLEAPALARIFAPPGFLPPPAAQGGVG